MARRAKRQEQQSAPQQSAPRATEEKDAPWEPAVWCDCNRHIAIEVARGRKISTLIEMGTSIGLSKWPIEDFLRDWQRMEYPIGRAAFKFLNSATGVLTMSDKVREIMEVILKTYVLDVSKVLKVTKFADEESANKAASGKKNLVVINEETVNDCDLAKVGKALKATVDPANKEAAKKAIMEILSRVDNPQPEQLKAAAKRGRGAPQKTLDDAMRAKIKAFLENNKDLAYSKTMKAAANAGLSPTLVKIVRKEIGHRTRDTWTKAAGTPAKAKPTKESAEAKAKAKAKEVIAIVEKHKAQAKAKAATATTAAKPTSKAKPAAAKAKAKPAAAKGKKK